MIFDEELHVEKLQVSPLRETMERVWIYVQDRWYKLTHCLYKKP